MRDRPGFGRDCHAFFLAISTLRGPADSQFRRCSNALLGSQNRNEWSNVQKVQNTILVAIRLGEICVRCQESDKWTDI